MFEALLTGFAAMAFWEWVAVALSVAYVVLAVKENIWCWPAALGSTIIYTWLFYEVNLLMDSLLNVYYMLMALYGFYCWNKRKADDSAQAELQISSWPWQKHLAICAALAFVVAGLGWYMDNHTSADFAYLDTATTVYAVFGTWLVARKVLENWIYWIVIDFVSIYLYFSKSLMPTAALFVLYVIIATVGYIQWKKRYQQQELTISPQANLSAG